MRIAVRTMVLSCLVTAIVGIAASLAGAQAERITLEVVLTAGRDPNVNVIQDYGDITWTAALEREFQKEYPHVDVVFRKGNKDQVLVMIAAGTGPDIINGQGAWFTSAGRQGAFMNLAPRLAQEGIDFTEHMTYWPPQLEAFRYQDQLFALPQYLGTMAMVYNADMFAQVGLEDPDPNVSSNRMDWEEFERMARKLTRDFSGDGIPDVWGFTKSFGIARVYYWLKAAGSDFYGNEDRTIATLDNPAAIEALEYLQSLRWDAQVIAPPGTPSSWIQGQAAIYETGSWDLVNFLGRTSSGEPKVSFAWNVFPMPIGPSGERATLATIDGYAVNKNTRYPDEAYALVKFLSGPAANEIMAKYLALQPAHRDVVPEYIDLMRSLNREAYDVNVHVFTDAGPYAYPKLLYSEPEVAESVLAEAYKKIFDGRQAVGPVWSEAISRLNEILSTSWERRGGELLTWMGDTWTTGDLNTLMPGRAVVRSDGTLEISASGADIWSYRDGFRYVFRPVTGNFSATVTLHSAPDTNAWSKSGIMLRAEATDGAQNVALLGTHQNGLVMQVRPAAGELTQQVKATDWANGNPVLLRLDRLGHKVTAMFSTDGRVWTTLGTVELELPETVLIGMASTSHVAGTLGSAVFSGWSLVRY